MTEIMSVRDTCERLLAGEGGVGVRPSNTLERLWLLAHDSCIPVSVLCSDVGNPGCVRLTPKPDLQADCQPRPLIEDISCAFIRISRPPQ